MPMPPGQPMGFTCFCVVPKRPHREREQEMYGPKKRGPKPKTLLLKARAQAKAASSSRILPLRQQQQQPPKPSARPPTSCSSLASPRPPTSCSSFPSPRPPTSSSSPSPAPLSNAKLQSGAAQHKLKKDIHRCHRMSRRPLTRPDPLSQPMGSSAALAARPPSFSETVRILNRKVKPREVKRGRIILNLKVLDKPGGAARPLANHRTRAPQPQQASPAHRSMHAGRQTVPPRTRVAGKSRRFGEVPYRGLQMLSALPSGTHRAQRAPSEPTRPPVDRTGPPALPLANPRVPGSDMDLVGHPKASSTPPEHLPPPSGVDGPCLAPPSVQPIPNTPGGARPWPDPPSLQPHAAGDPPSPPSSPLSPSSSSDDANGVQILDLSLAQDVAARGRRGDHRHLHHPGRCHNDFSSEPHYGARLCPGDGDGDPDWHPEMTVRCANVVVTDVTTNLLTVTIKEFCPPTSADADSPATGPSPTTPTNSARTGPAASPQQPILPPQAKP
ncbi:hypothetical protein ACEWY4_026449 [Coilia grayii]|uniref:Uncharacterized protein n=1 Tax=Coilia grayii TaxID=363190 RepID=A0ABD1IUX3_9TELE